MTNFSKTWSHLRLVALLVFGTLAAHAQNVGINMGASTPTQTLDINGSLRIRGLNGTGNRLPMVQADGTVGINAPVYSTDPAPTVPTGAASNVDTNGSTQDVAVVGTTAYVLTAGTSSLKIYNVASPSGPVLLSTLALGGAPLAVAVNGSMAYIANGSVNLMQVVNVANPSAPSLVGSASTGSSGEPRGIAVNGTTVCVANRYGNALQVFDVTTPSSPSLVGSATCSSPWRVAMSGNTAYVACLGSNSMQIVDVTTPSSPSLLGSVGIGGIQHVAVSGTIIYAVGTSNIFSVINVANSSAPVIVGSVSAGSGSSFREVAVSGSIAYAADRGTNSLGVFNVANPSAPALLGTVSSPTPEGVAASGTTAYIISNQGGSTGLQIFPSPLGRTVAVNPDGSFSSVASPTLSVSGQNLSITGGNTVTLPTTTASNGLTATGTNIALGGTLTNATNIPLAGYNLTFSGTGQVSIGGSAAPTSTLDVRGAIAKPYTTTGTTANFALDNTQYTVTRGSATTTTVTLPDPSTCAGRIYVLINPSSQTSTLTLAVSGTSKTVVDATTGTTYSSTGIPTGTRLTVQSDGASTWQVIGR
ncbi:MAG: hypothetical protein ACRYFX_03150 [Janthinobacterium lividum]